MEKYESPTIEPAGGPGKVDPQQLIIFFVAAMYVIIAGILVAYGTTCIKFR
jgi:hypothetical protein